MSLILKDCKGVVHALSTGGANRSAGFYSIKPPLPNKGGGYCVILGITLALQEIVQPTVTLDDKRALYVFGSAWNEVTLQGVMLLGGSSSHGAVAGALQAWYEENRVSVSKKSVSVSIGTSAGMQVYVVGLRLEAANPEFNTQNFSIILLTPGKS
jgi:hypothetical protein